MKKHTIFVITITLIASLLSACTAADSFLARASEPVTEISSQTNTRISTSNTGSTDFETVFPQDKVNEITIQISPENWQAMLDDMTELYGEQGTGSGLRQPGQGGGREPQGDFPAAPEGGREGQPPQGGNFPGGGGGMQMESDSQNPVWVEAQVTFEGESWEHIGIRFKGNSSLRSTWSAGSLKLPFKLDFDQYEDDYPETENQRFYGFKQLTFSSNFHDDSFLREKITADLFREGGVPSAHTAFYAVSIDYGEGPVYLGLYTAVEVVDDTLIETQFRLDTGNVYKPEGSGATFAAGSFTEDSFDKETNQDEEDYSDILALFEKLHASTRTSDPETWREELESIFDVDGFLNWLALNTLIQNWDTYGVMQHNYYLYNDPVSGQLVWIPWDNNESLKSSQGMRSALSLSLDEVNNNWPLISYLRDDPVYFQKYLAYLDQALETVFLSSDLADRFQYYHDLITPYVESESPENTLLNSLAAFERSVDELIQHVQSRASSAEAFLSANQ